MALYGYDDCSFGISTASGSTAIIPMSQYVFSISPLKIETITAETHAMGDSWREVNNVGLKQADDITIGGALNDVASGPHFYMGNVSNIGSTRLIYAQAATAGGFRALAVLKSYSIMPARGELTMFEAVWSITGAVTTAS